MNKEGESVVEEKDRTPLQKMTGQGKETGGIKFPSPSLNVLASLEQQFGDLGLLAKKKELGANIIRMMIFLLEMQKAGKDEEVAIMNDREIKAAAAKLVKEKNITIENFQDYGRAANEVFTKALSKSKK